MATYKVPQDVEAEDKLVAFLSLKQFIFVIVMFACLWMCWILFQVNFLLGLIPLPVAFVSGVLGLYQRKDQPIEVYLASWLRFKLKPRARKWDQEGLEEHVIINAPKVVDKHYTKGYSRDQVSSHLNQLSSMLDSRGWASRRAIDPSQQSQRLFSMQELERYSQPLSPLENDRDVVADQFDASDPRNRTVQEVSKDFEGSAKKQRAHALEVVEEARKKATYDVPVPAADKTPTSATPAPPVMRTAGPAPSPVKPEEKPAPEPSQTSTSAEQTDDSEVVIDLHNKHKA